jgi:hypothetical protein
MDFDFITAVVFRMLFALVILAGNFFYPNEGEGNKHVLLKRRLTAQTTRRFTSDDNTHHHSRCYTSLCERICLSGFWLYPGAVFTPVLLDSKSRVTFLIRDSVLAEGGRALNVGEPVGTVGAVTVRSTIPFICTLGVSLK